MDKPGCVLTQLYLQNQVEWICWKGHGLLTPRLEQRKNESEKTGLSRSSLINGEKQNGARELRLLTEAEGSFRLQEDQVLNMGWAGKWNCAPHPCPMFPTRYARTPSRTQSTSLIRASCRPCDSNKEVYSLNQGQSCQGTHSRGKEKPR